MATTAETTEVLEPSSQWLDVVIGPEEAQMHFVQKPLSFFGKLDLIGALGKAMDEAMRGPDGISIAELFEVPIGETTTMDDIKAADGFVRAVSRLAWYAPDLLAEVYCIALAVPRGRRDVVKEYMRKPEDEGGISDEMGEKILDTFVAQNLEVMQDFFVRRLLPLFERIGKTVTAPDQSASSKPSRASRRATGGRSKSS